MHTVKYLKEKNHIIFSYNKNSKICINMHFGLKTSLLKSQELGQYLKNFKIFFFLLSGITTLYVRCIPDIKFFCLR
jgi:hypothetical protein